MVIAQISRCFLRFLQRRPFFFAGSLLVACIDDAVDLGAIWLYRAHRVRRLAARNTEARSSRTPSQLPPEDRVPPWRDGGPRSFFRAGALFSRGGFQLQPAPSARDIFPDLRAPSKRALRVRQLALFRFAARRPDEKYFLLTRRSKAAPRAPETCAPSIPRISASASPLNAGRSCLPWGLHKTRKEAQPFTRFFLSLRGLAAQQLTNFFVRRLSFGDRVLDSVCPPTLQYRIGRIQEGLRDSVCAAGMTEHNRDDRSQGRSPRAHLFCAGAGGIVAFYQTPLDGFHQRGFPNAVGTFQQIWRLWIKFHIQGPRIPL